MTLSPTYVVDGYWLVGYDDSTYPITHPLVPTSAPRKALVVSAVPRLNFALPQTARKPFPAD